MTSRDRGVVLVHDGFNAQETWPFECLRCWHVWEVHYVVRTVTDDHGNEVRVWLRSGVPVQPPTSGVCCPGCGAYHATSFPRGYLSRHPELLPAPRPRPVAAVAAPVRRAVPSRAPWPGRLLVAMGAPVLAFVGYELYENLVAVTGPH
ncbi:hypothetical protein OIE66_11335 [Nonomuraea sp. NBC_01738]|uniref:hypothetical protein n=1 Tax=Nonomuraea sp. NBC_01738 TaxID=2976003 RepID=UPI002E12C6F4|nr:hypothetical protein OIE66_11335 [Nonomuraea sp. NBC_01738]